MITTEIFLDIISLHRQGYSMRTIAQKLGIHRNTVKRDIEGNTFPQYRKTKRQESILDPYQQTVDDYLAADEYQATSLCADDGEASPTGLQHKGFKSIN